MQALPIFLLSGAFGIALFSLFFYNPVFVGAQLSCQMLNSI